MKLRQLKSGDCGTLKSLFAVVRDDPAAAAFHPHPFTDKQAEVIASYSGQDIYAGYFDGDKIVAYGMLRGRDEGYEVPSLGIYLSPQARGTGIARKMMEGLHELARTELKASKIMLKVYTDNIKAAALYERMGYEFEPPRNGEAVGFLEL